MGEIKTVVFVGGSVRSGTTVVGLFLANALNGFALGEVVALFNRRRRKLISNLSESMYYNSVIDINESKPKDFYTKVFKHFNQFDVFIDSSKNPHWIKYQTEKLSTSGVRVFNVLVYKEPAHLFKSLKKRDKENNLIRLVKSYYNQYIIAFNDVGVKTYVINYQDLFNVKLMMRITNEIVDNPKIEYEFNYKQYLNIGGSNTLSNNDSDFIQVINRSDITTKYEHNDDSLEYLYNTIENNNIMNVKDEKLFHGFKSSYLQYLKYYYHRMVFSIRILFVNNFLKYVKSLQ